MKGKTLVVGIVITVFLVGLMSLGRITGTTVSGTWKDTTIACLVSGHQNLAFHMHTGLQITVDGEREPIPSNIGVSGTCMAETHTHDSTGTIHAESAEHGKQFTLNDFFSVWEKDLERDGYELSMLVNGTPSSELGNLILTDNQQIALVYTSSQNDAESFSEGDTPSVNAE